LLGIVRREYYVCVVVFLCKNGGDWIEKGKKEVRGISVGVTEPGFFPGLMHRLAKDRVPLGNNTAPVAFWRF